MVKHYTCIKAPSDGKHQHDFLPSVQGIWECRQGKVFMPSFKDRDAGISSCHLSLGGLGQTEHERYAGASWWIEHKRVNKGLHISEVIKRVHCFFSGVPLPAYKQINLASPLSSHM